jgi:hypothetical protein
MPADRQEAFTALPEPERLCGAMSSLPGRPHGCRYGLDSMSGYRVFWYYGPGPGEITILAITPHP